MIFCISLLLILKYIKTPFLQSVFWNFLSTWQICSTYPLTSIWTFIYWRGSKWASKILEISQLLRVIRFVRQLIWSIIIFAQADVLKIQVSAQKLLFDKNQNIFLILQGITWNSKNKALVAKNSPGLLLCIPRSISNSRILKLEPEFTAFAV